MLRGRRRWLRDSRSKGARWRFSFWWHFKTPRPQSGGALSTKIAPENLYTIEAGKWIIDSPAATSKSLTEALGFAETMTFFVHLCAATSDALSQTFGSG
jgi:hypothetical protein